MFKKKAQKNTRFKSFVELILAHSYGIVSSLQIFYKYNENGKTFFLSKEVRLEIIIRGFFLGREMRIKHWIFQTEIRYIRDNH